MNTRSTRRCVSKSTPQPQRSGRTRGRASTAQELQTALLRVKDKGLKISITAVAAEAGVVPSLIHNTYPDIAEQIRGLVGRTARRQRDEMRTELAAVRQRLRDVTAEREQLRKDMAVLVSLNLALTDRLSELRAEIDGKLRRMVSGPS
jgi:AcrR family transcriptional regulator